MAIVTGWMIAALLLAPQAVDPRVMGNLNPPTSSVADVEVEGEDREVVREDIARRNNPTEVICETRPVTGSRFTHRRCRTREQAGVAQSEAQRVLNQITGAGVPDPGTLSGPSFGPQ